MDVSSFGALSASSFGNKVSCSGIKSKFIHWIKFPVYTKFYKRILGQFYGLFMNVVATVGPYLFEPTLWDIVDNIEARVELVEVGNLLE